MKTNKKLRQMRALGCKLKAFAILGLLLAVAGFAPCAYAYQINATGSTPLAFGTGSTSATATEKMRITSAGLVGIATATPTTPLEVSGTVSATSVNVGYRLSVFSNDPGNPSVIVQNNSSLGYDGFNLNDETGTLAGTISYSNSGAFLPGSFLIGGRNTTAPLIFLAGGVVPLERMRITATGNIGISTTNPTTKLEVNGTISATQFVGDGSLLTGISGGGGGGDNITSGTTKVTANNTGYISLTTGGVTTGYFDTNGVLVVPGISTTTGRISTTYVQTSGITPEIMSLNALNDASTNVTSRTIYMGYLTGMSNTGGSQTTAVGFASMMFNTTGSNNTALGSQSLRINTTGVNNVAVGADAVGQNVTGTDIIGIGYQAAYQTNANYNIAVGTSSLYNNVSGTYNIGMGYQSLYYNTAGNNIAIGHRSMYINTTGNNNTALGYQSLYNNNTGSSNVALGYMTMNSGNGDNNIAIGSQAMTSTNGSNNIGIGSQSLRNTYGSPNVGLGNSTLYNTSSGSGNVAIGDQAGYNNTSGNDNIFLGRGTNGPTAATATYLNIGNAISGSMTSSGSLTFIGGIKANGSVTATYFEGDGSRLTNVGGTPSQITSASTYVQTQSGGAVLISTTGLYINNAQGTQDTALRLGANATGNHNSYIDLIGDSTYSTYGLRLIRSNSGPNAYSAIQHRGTGSLALQTNESSPIDFYTSSTLNMRIMPSGFVGIGTNSPATPLHVSGTATADAFNGPLISNTTTLAISGAGMTLTNTSLTTTAISVVASSTAAASIELGQSRTGSGYSYIDLSGDTTYSDYGLRIIRNNTGANASSQIFHRGTGDLSLYTQEAAPIAFLTSSIERMRILSTGFVGIGTATPAVTLHVSGTLRVQNGAVVTCNIGTGTGTTSCTSDRRLKTDITPIPDSLEKIATLSGITFHWKDPTAPKGEHLGVIAQDVEKVFPQAVATMENGYKTVDYGVLVAPLIEAVKQLRTENLALKAEQQRTNARLNALEHRFSR